MVFVAFDTAFWAFIFFVRLRFVVLYELDLGPMPELVVDLP